MPTTVDKIRSALEKRDGIAEEEMRPLAEAYRGQVQAVNQRLDDAVMLLRKGLRSEAIQRVEMAPNALESAAELEFPEWDDWNEILQFMGIPLPPKLNQDYVSQINEAIIESLPLDALLGRHRRLAIAKAPLSVRLRTLRQIARVDPSNRVWNEDVESWEKVRLQQIDSELNRALEHENGRRLYELSRELTQDAWRITPSSRLIEQSSFAAESYVRQIQEAELKKIGPQLVDAHERGDEQTARRLRGEWQSVRSRYEVEIPEHLEASVAPALRWLEDLDRQKVMESERELAITELESALEANKSIESIQQAYDQASRFDKPVPAELARRVERLATAPARKRKQKRILIGSVAGLFALAAIISGAMMFLSSSKQQARKEKIAQMQDFVDKEQFDAALTFYGSLQAADPQFAADPQLIAMKSTAERAIKDQAYRVERFEKLLGQAESEDPALIDDSLFPQLDELASSEGERARVEDIKRRKGTYLQRETEKQSEAMLADLAQMRNTFSQLQSRGSSSANRQAIGNLLTSVARLPRKYPLRNDDAVAKHQVLRDQVSDALSRMKDSSMIAEQRDEAIESLITARSLDAYGNVLDELSTRSVARSGFIEFDTVLDEMRHWDNVQRTNRWLDEFGKRLVSGVTSSEANALIESAEELQADVRPNPVLLRMPDFFDKMEEITARRQILSEVFTRITRHPLAKAVTLTVPDATMPSGNKVQFLYADEAKQNADRMSRTTSFGMQIITDELGGTRNRPFEGPLPKVSPEPSRTIEYVVNQKSKKEINLNQYWERTLILMVADIRKRPELDGRIKEWLIDKLLTAGARGSEQLKQMIPQTLQILKRRTSVRERWYEPRNKNTSLTPELDAMIRAELPIALNRLSTPFLDYQQIAESELEWIGFLAESPSGQIEPHLRGPLPEEDGTIYVATPADEPGAETAIVSVGKLQRGHIQLTPNPVYQVPGRPLFLFPN